MSTSFVETYLTCLTEGEKVGILGMFQENMDPFILLKSCELFGFIMPSQHYQQIANTTSVPACTIHVSFLTTEKKFHGAGSTYTTLVH